MTVKYLKAVTAHLKSTQLMHFGFAEQNNYSKQQKEAEENEVGGNKLTKITVNGVENCPPGECI